MITPLLRTYLKECTSSFVQISDERQAQLQLICDYIKDKEKAEESARLVVICTHNSRRSHFGQLWLKTAAYYYEFNKLQTYSGGTEATAFNPRAVAAAKRAGFIIETKQQNENPIYEVTVGNNLPKELCFSKKFDHPDNPTIDFAAIMVCNDADENCPFIPGAEARFSLPFIDPKASDNTSEEEAIYDLRCRQIAIEMMWLMKKVVGA